MGLKKNTLLRWVNCCYESITPIQRLQELSDGLFFLQILNIENTCDVVTISPWARISRVIREQMLNDDIINFKTAAARDEDEIAKLIVVCMHLTMVVKSCEMIQEKTMLTLSNEDQLVIKSILHAIVNDDQLTRTRLAEILYEPSEPVFSKPCTFYSSSPAPSAARNSPLKRFLDSPINRRVSRLQKEILDKNEEISRLQSEIISEADGTCTLKEQIDDLHKKVKEYERKQSEMNQRLADYQCLEKTSHETEAEMNALKKQLKKLQNDYETSSQKFCDLNIEYEANKNQQEKDRKQIRQLQLDLNEAAARFQRETAGFQLQMDSARIENVQLKHVLDEKKQWIEVLEEKSQLCHETHTRVNVVPKSPGERESIGFSLLSIEAEKLQDELLANRKELLSQKEKSESEKKVFQLRLDNLDQERHNLMQQIESANTTNESLQNQLSQAKSFIEEVSQGCDVLRKEKEQLNMSLATVKSDFDRDMDQAQQQLEIRENELLKKSNLIRSLEKNISETLALQDHLQKTIEQLGTEKAELLEKIELLEQNRLEMQTALETTRSEFLMEIEDKVVQMKSAQQQVAEQLLAVQQLEANLEKSGQELASSNDKFALLEADKCQLSKLNEDLEQGNFKLQETLEKSEEEFINQLEIVNQKWQLANNDISEKLKCFIDKSELLEADKCQLSELSQDLKQKNSDLQKTLEKSEEEFQHQLEMVNQKWELANNDISEKLKSIVEKSEFLETDKCQLSKLNEDLEQQNSTLRETLEKSEEEFENQLEKVNRKWELANNDISEKLKFVTEKSELLEADQCQLSKLSQDLELKNSNLQTTLEKSEEEYKNQLASVNQQWESANNELSEKLKCVNEKSELLESDKCQLSNLIEHLELKNSELEKTFEKSENEYKNQLDSVDRKWELANAQRSGEMTSINEKLHLLEADKLQLSNSIQDLEQKNTELQNTLEKSEEEFQNQLESVNRKWELTNGEISGKLTSTSTQLEATEQQKNQLLEVKETLSQERESLLQDLDKFKTEMNGVSSQLEAKERTILEQADSIKSLELQHQETMKQLSDVTLEMNGVSSELETKKREILEQGEFMKSLELQHQETIKQLGNLESVVSVFEKEAEEYVATNRYLEDQISQLQKTMESKTAEFRTQLDVKQQELSQLIADHHSLHQENSDNKSTMEKLQVEFETKINSVGDEMERLDAVKVSLEQRMEEMIVKQKVSEQEQLRLDGLTNRLSEELEQQKKEHSEQMDVLNERTRVADEDKLELQSKCSRLEAERENLQFDRSSFEQLYMEIKAAYEEAEAHFNVEMELARDSKSAKEVQCNDISKELTQQQIILQEKQTMLERIKTEKSALENQVLELVELQKVNVTHQEQFQMQLDSKLLEINELNESLKNHEVEIVKLKGEIEQLSANKMQVEQLRKQHIKEKEDGIVELKSSLEESCRIQESLKLQMTTLQADKKHLLEKISILEASDSEHQNRLKDLTQEMEEKKSFLAAELATAKEQYEVDIANLHNDMLKLEQMVAQKSATFKIYEKEMKDMQDLVEQKSNRLFIEKERFQMIEMNLKKELSALKIMKNHEHSELVRNFERKEQELATASVELSSLKSQVEELLLTNAVNDETIQELRSKCESADKVVSLETERDVLLKKVSTLEQEISLSTTSKSELKSEKDQKALEHRKEKAVLEARVQLAQTQMKSMQQKLVNMTVANQSQTPLQHKISTLTNELEAALKSKSELEKQVEQSNNRPQELSETQTLKEPSTSDSESAILRKKYDSAKKALNSQEEVINQYASKFEKMQSQLDVQGEELANLTVDKRKLTFENRSLKVEQQHLLAQIAAEKDRATSRSTRLTLALQRSTSETDGGTMADAMLDARRRSLRPSRSEVVQSTRSMNSTTSMNDESFRAPRLVFGADGSDNSVFKVPSAQSSRRDSTSSISSNRSDVSTTSKLPHGAGRLFTCDDEDGELFSSSYLNEMKEGLCNVESSSQRRMSELHRRNTLQPPHMRSAYPAEMNDERLRKMNSIPLLAEESCSSSSASSSMVDEKVHQLATATSLLSVHTPPAMNTRKRRSSSWNQTETPVLRKRRSFEADLSIETEDSRLSISSSAERRKKREPTQTTYKRPGPPTPARNSSLKENVSTPSMSTTSSPKSTPRSSSRIKSKRSSPQGNRSSKLTPASLVRKVQSKLRSNRQAASEQTPSSSTTPRGKSKLNIFRKPLGSRGYNSDGKF